MTCGLLQAAYNTGDLYGRGYLRGMQPRIPGISVEKQQGSNSERLMIRGFLQSSLDDTPPFRIFYHGKTTQSNGEGFFSIPLDDEEIPDELYLLICSSFNQHFENVHTIKHLVIEPAKDHLLYRIFKGFNKEKRQREWMFEQTSLKEHHFVVPQPCLIVCINPYYVKNVSMWSIDLGNNVIKLPKIVLKSEFTAEDIAKGDPQEPSSLEWASNKSLMNTLHALNFHESVSERTKETNGVSLSITH